MAGNAWAQSEIAETEPNNSCAEAQDLGKAPGITLSGEVELQDVDYFRITAKAGKILQADMSGYFGGGGDMIGAMIGAFDSECRQIGYNNYGGDTMDALMVFTVPEDGVLYLAATGVPDYEFTGDTFQIGTYTLSVHDTTVGYVKGHLTDAATGEPLQGVDPQVTLLQCPDAGYTACTSTVATGPVAADGSYVFSLAGASAGAYYQLRANPDGYGYAYSAPFYYDGSASSIKANLKVSSLPVSIGNISDCLRSEQGTDCSYQATLTNLSADTLKLDVWTLIDVNITGAPYGHSTFTTGSALHTPVQIKLQPGEQKTITQVLPVADAWTGVVATATILASKRNKPEKTLAGSTVSFTIDPHGATVGSATTALRAANQAQLARTRKPAAQPARGINISGHVLDSVTGAPVDGDYPPTVLLYRCLQTTDTRCTTFLANTASAEDGSFSFGATRLEDGRYQVMANGSNHQLSYSEIFTFKGRPVSDADILFVPTQILMTDLGFCEDFWALPQGQDCNVSYTLTNQTDSPQTLQAWVSASVTPTGSALDSTAVSGLMGDAATSVFTIEPGASLQLEAPMPKLGTMPAGSYYYPSVWISPPGNPFAVQKGDQVPGVAVVPATP